MSLVAWFRAWRNRRFYRRCLKKYRKLLWVEQPIAGIFPIVAVLWHGEKRFSETERIRWNGKPPCRIARLWKKPAAAQKGAVRWPQ